MSIAIDKVTIKIGNKSHDLSVEECKELRDILNATFPRDTAPPHFFTPWYEHPWKRWVPMCSNISADAGHQHLTLTNKNTN